METTKTLELTQDEIRLLSSILNTFNMAIDDGEEDYGDGEEDHIYLNFSDCLLSYSPNELKTFRTLCSKI